MGAEEAKPVFPPEQHFSEYELEELHAAFDEIDKDKNNYLDESEFQIFLQNSKQHADSALLILKVFGSGPDSSISFEDFCRYIHSLTIPNSSSESFPSLVFRILDKDNSGYVSAKEFLEYAKIIKGKFTLKDAQKIIAENAADKKKGMTQPEIVQYLYKLIN